MKIYPRYKNVIKMRLVYIRIYLERVRWISANGWHTRDDYLLLWQRLPATWLLLTSTSAVNRSQNLSSRCWYSFEIYEFITSYSNISMIWFLLLRNWSIGPINIINSWIGFLIIPQIISIRTKIISELNERKVEKK